MLNKKMIIGFVIHIIITIFCIGETRYPFLVYLVGAVVAFNLLGVLFIQFGKMTLGAKVFMYSSFVLVPIGMIAAIGARDIIDEEKRKKFEQENN